MITTTETLPVKTAPARLAEHYPYPALGLDFENPRQLLIAPILAAQARDTRIV